MRWNCCGGGNTADHLPRQNQSRILAVIQSANLLSSKDWRILVSGRLFARSNHFCRFGTAELSESLPSSDNRLAKSSLESPRLASTYSGACTVTVVAFPTAGLSWRRLTERCAGGLRGCEVGDAALRGCTEDCSIISPRWVFWMIGRRPNHCKSFRPES